MRFSRLILTLYLKTLSLKSLYHLTHSIHWNHLSQTPGIPSFAALLQLQLFLTSLWHDQAQMTILLLKPSERCGSMPVMVRLRVREYFSCFTGDQFIKLIQKRRMVMRLRQFPTLGSFPVRLWAQSHVKTDGKMTAFCKLYHTSTFNRSLNRLYHIPVQVYTIASQVVSFVQTGKLNICTLHAIIK